MKKLFWPFIIFFLFGCATNADRHFMLNQTLITYEKTYRWGEYANLLNFRKSSTAQDAERVSTYENIRISGYQVKRQIPVDDTYRISFDVEISYFTTNDNRIQSVIDTQTWEYDKDAKRWFIKSPLPILR